MTEWQTGTIYGLPAAGYKAWIHRCACSPSPYFVHGTIHGLCRSMLCAWYNPWIVSIHALRTVQSMDYYTNCGSTDCAGQSTDCPMPDPYFAHNGLQTVIVMPTKGYQ